jgi:hypothetical protein
MPDQKQGRSPGLSVEGNSLPPCFLCGDDLSSTTSYSLQGDLICLKCLLYLGPERARILLKVKKLEPLQIASAVAFLRELFTRNQTLRLKEAIRNGGRNWWVKLPEFGEYVCQRLMDQGGNWDSEVLDEVWDRLVKEAVED